MATPPKWDFTTSIHTPNSDAFKHLMERYEKDLFKITMIPPNLLARPRWVTMTVNAVNGSSVESAGVRLGEVEAWRLWRVDGHRLKSVARDVTWLPGVPMVGDPAPSNRAGVYAFREPDDAHRELSSVSNVPLVLGKVKLWGRYVEHERGYRAEFARITSLVASSSSLGYRVEVDALRSLYLDLRCPTDLTPVVDPQGRTVGVTTLRWSGRYVDDQAPPVAVPEPMKPLTGANWLISEGPEEMLSHQYHRWRGRALLLEPGQDPTWLPGWLPLPNGARY